MIAPGSIKFDKRFKNRIMARYQKYDLQAGVLKDKPYKLPNPRARSLGTLEGGPVRRTQRKTKGTVARVSKKVRQRVDYLRLPFKKNNRVTKKFLKVFFETVGGRIKGTRTLRDALLVMIQTPLLRQDYGKNTPVTKAIKGFNRFLFDTGQLYKNIKAKVGVRRVSKGP